VGDGGVWNEPSDRIKRRVLGEKLNLHLSDERLLLGVGQIRRATLGHFWQAPKLTEEE